MQVWNSLSSTAAAANAPAMNPMSLAPRPPFPLLSPAGLTLASALAVVPPALEAALDSCPADPGPLEGAGASDLSVTFANAAAVVDCVVSVSAAGDANAGVSEVSSVCSMAPELGAASDAVAAAGARAASEGPGAGAGTGAVAGAGAGWSNAASGNGTPYGSRNLGTAAGTGAAFEP